LIPTTFLHTGGGCTALQVRCEAGRHLLITDTQDSLAWSRDAQQGWAVGAYRDDAAEEPESFHTTNDSTTPALLTLVRHTLCSVRQPRAQEGPVMSTEGTHEDATHEVDGDEPIEVGDLLDDPRTDVEALCLCALLWSPTDTASDVSDLVRSTDFERGVYGELFEVITAQVRSGAPHDPASIASRLTQSGRTGGHRGAQLTRALSSVTIAGAVPETPPVWRHYARHPGCSAREQVRVGAGGHTTTIRCPWCSGANDRCRCRRDGGTDVLTAVHVPLAMVMGIMGLVVWLPLRSRHHSDPTMP